MRKRPMKRVKAKTKDAYHVSYEREKKYNFLKYWRIVKYYVKRKYNLPEADLEMLLFLYDEGRFTKEQFNEYSNIMHWDRERFWRMTKNDFIVVWRKKTETFDRRNIYELSVKGKRVVNIVYKRLLMEETFSENPYVNPIMKGSSYTDKVYRRAIKSMNKKINGSPES